MATAEVPQVDLDMLIKTDPVANQLSTELGWKKIDAIYQTQAAKNGVNNPYVARFDQDVQRLQNQYDERVKLLVEKAKQKQRSTIQSKIIELQAVLQPQQEAQKKLAAEIAKLKDEAENIGQTSVDIQMIQAKLKNLDQVLANFVTERERLRAEIKSTPRITVAEPADYAADAVEHLDADRVDVLWLCWRASACRRLPSPSGTRAPAASIRQPTCRRVFACR